MERAQKLGDLDLQSSEVACAWTNTNTVNLPTGNVPRLPEAPHTAGINVPSVAPLIYSQQSCWLMGSQRPECLSPDDDMPPAASSNHHTVYCCQQPGDKQQHL